MNPFLEIQDLRTYFYTRWGTVKAVNGVSFSVNAGETFGIVGESGCGKSITALSILGLVPEPAGKIVGGNIFYRGENLVDKNEKEMREIRGREISMILQDPMTSLNPVFTVGNQVEEAIKIHQKIKGSRLKQRAVQILEKVRIPSPDVRMKNWPHELSGGMRQRVVGAMAMACEPNLLIADEPTTALDMTIQMQYLDLLQDIQAKTGLSIIFITHDFGVIAYMCKRAAVMYAGKIVECADVRTLFDRPCHPYTQALMKSIPKAEEKVDALLSIEGQPPPLNNLPVGCAFNARCPKAEKQCSREAPTITEVGNQHVASCWLLD